jgi:hypothetical protein
VPADGLFILGDLVDEPQLVRCVLCHSNDEFSLPIVVSFSCDALEPFVADAGLNEFAVDGGVVDSDEAVGSEEVEKLV